MWYVHSVCVLVHQSLSCTSYPLNQKDQAQRSLRATYNAYIIILEEHHHNI